ncbi:tetratricopeptide repeat protein, partial [Arthrospira platensis SPKY1]|nr:tetratricopeptide repeat protein [Arthrospira platensis SPKY1]
EVNREIGSQRGIAICYNDMGDIYRLRGDNDKALNYYQMSLHLNEAIQDRYYLSINNLRLAEIFSEKNVNIEAIKYAKKAIELSIETSNRNNLAKAYELMYKLQR